MGRGGSSYYLHHIDNDNIAHCVDPHVIRISNIDKVGPDNLLRIPVKDLAPSLCLGFKVENPELRSLFASLLRLVPLSGPMGVR